MSFGRPRLHLRLAGSTNDRARELAAAGAPAGMVVTATEQSAGRGRQGRTWTAPAGKALLASAILRPLDSRHRLLPLAVPLAVAEAVEEVAPLRAEIKWPNDVWVDGRKVAGVLIEARPQDGWAVIGVGLNVAIEAGELPPELRESATSVGHGVGVEAMLDALCERLDRWTAAGPEQVREAFAERDALRGRELTWDGGAGTADGIDADGNLVVVSGGERISLGAGEVHLALG